MIVRIDAKAWGVGGSNLSVGLTLSVLISNFDSSLKKKFGSSIRQTCLIQFLYNSAFYSPLFQISLLLEVLEELLVLKDTALYQMSTCVEMMLHLLSTWGIGKKVAYSFRLMVVIQYMGKSSSVPAIPGLLIPAMNRSANWSEVVFFISYLD